MKSTSVLVGLLAAVAAFAQSVDKKALAQLEGAAEKTHSEALIVWQDGKIVSEKYFFGGRPDKKTETMSATKSIVSLAVGKLVTDGRLHLDSAVCRYYPEWRQGQKRRVTVRMLLNHTSGLQNVPNTTVEIMPSRDIVQLALCAELEHPPGKAFFYNNKAVNLLAGIIEKASSQPMDVYVRENLFVPLGITDSYWMRESDIFKDLGRAGTPYAMFGCQLTARDFLKIGRLVLNRGRWEEKQLVSTEYMDECLKPNPLYGGCGLLWWLLYDKTESVVDERKISELTHQGLSADFIAKVRKLMGVYPDEDAFQKAVQAVFGENGMMEIQQALGSSGLRLRERRYGKVIGYAANGYLGNYIVVIPDKKLVAVRMTSHDSHKTDADNFADFEKLVAEL
ncbi:MAG: beta-lactamase family protein [Cytophagales bacterium]|jgi:CubicO group peptidase (beta-lactamase class C family)|nr:beta-lactamase family protein [Cytophagales bacterium]